jgi:hypothetical protein
LVLTPSWRAVDDAATAAESTPERGADPFAGMFARPSHQVVVGRPPVETELVGVTDDCAVPPDLLPQRAGVDKDWREIEAEREERRRPALQRRAPSAANGLGRFRWID